MHSAKCTSVLLGIIALGWIGACTEDGGQAPDDGGQAPDLTGELRVSATTTGPDFNAYYMVYVDGNFSGQVLPAIGSIVWNNVPVGTRKVTLVNVTTNCKSTPLTAEVTVEAGQQANVNFEITCVARVGEIAVTIATTGNLLPAGYQLALDNWEDGQPVSINVSKTLVGVREGPHHLYLRDVPYYCRVGEGDLIVDVRFGGPTPANFAVSCLAVTLTLTTVTSGPDPDPDGYTLLEPDGSTLSVADGTITLPVSATGSSFLALQGVASNCFAHVRGWLGSAMLVDPQRTSAVNFDVTCEPIPVKRFSTNRQLAFVRDGRIYRVNADGTNEVQMTNGPDDAGPVWSPDGQRLAFARKLNGQLPWIICVMDADGSHLRRVSEGFSPTWSSDGSKIAFSYDNDVYQVSAVDDGKAQTLLTHGGYQLALSPDWKSASATYSDDYDSQIIQWIVGNSAYSQLTAGTSGPLETNQWFYQPAWSPDAHKLAIVGCAFDSFESCTPSGVWLINADGSGLTKLTYAYGFAEPTWSPDGQFIAYVSAGSILWIRTDGSEKGLVVANGNSPAWRP